MSTAPTPSLEGPTVEGLIPRIDAAIERITSGCAPMRVPPDSCDPDLVLADCKVLLRRLTAKPAPARQPITEERWQRNAKPRQRGYYNTKRIGYLCDPQGMVRLYWDTERAGWFTSPHGRMRMSDCRIWEPSSLDNLSAIEAECADPAVVRMLTDEERRQAWKATWEEEVRGDTFMDGARYAAAIERKFIEVNGLKLEGDA